MYHPTIGNSKYSPEIDGLRAIAVLAVLLFHVDISWLSGGYIGVDIFFVISGYLITRNILSDLNNGSFTLKIFYTKRFRRLYPALLSTITITAIAALFILHPVHLSRFGREIVASIFSVSNFYFWNESGYFDLDSAFKPLMHTWSLAVEEQFYLVWPALLITISRLRKSQLQFVALTIIGVVSLYWSAYYVDRSSQSTAFYMLPFRVFEFVIGALLIYLPAAERFLGVALRSLLTLVGITLMLYSCVTYSYTTSFPGYMALPPCVGAALVIWSGRNVTSSILLENFVSKWLGKTSYSIYLVHWPLVVFTKYIYGSEFNPTTQAALIISSILLGYISWRWIEQLFRYTLDTTSVAKLNLKRYTSISLGIVLMLTISFEVSNGNVFQRKVALTAEEVSEGKSRRYKHYRQACRIDKINNSQNCNLSAPQQTLILGNSHEPDGFNIWREVATSQEQNVIVFGTTNKCNEFFDDINANHEDPRKCKQRIRILKDKNFIRSIDTIVYSANRPFSSNKEGFMDIFFQYKSINPEVKLVFLGGYFNLKKDCSFYIGDNGSPESCLAEEHISYDSNKEKSDYEKWAESKWGESINPIYLSKFTLLCEAGNCPASIENIPFSYDQHHLSFEFSKFIGEKLAKKLATERIEIFQN